MIDDVKRCLTIMLPSTADEAKTQLEACMKLTEPLLEARAEAFRKLHIERERFRHPKDKELTDLDRNTMLQAAVADLQRDAELYKGLEELLQQRINVLVSLSNQQ